ncbi:stage III sporulation protein AF [Bacillus sp. OV166]|uniref:stage III sporulation protein AF n=1 Tax=Bacillus sp. OV166 TaxID=1882763 RepID=UPI000A2ADE85|nr:stage III sporulation protein AF [Bacillus sp. OV166]SMQ80753.1 stage III sporulation protein AF [Bacillus sp. OV166]
MELLANWITSIIVFILFAVVVDMLLPNSVWKGYVKIVISLILILAIFKPILSLFKVDTETILSSVVSNNEIGKNSVDEKLNMRQEEIKKLQDESISGQVANQMKEIVAEELLSKYELAIKEIEVSPNEDHTKTSVLVSIGKVDSNDNQTVQEVQPLKPVSIKVNLPEEKSKGKEEQNVQEKKDVLTFLAKRWELEKSNITLSWE